jgi:hypothetical protein
VACMGSIQAKDPDCSAKRPMLEIYEMTKRQQMDTGTPRSQSFPRCKQKRKPWGW